MPNRLTLHQILCSECGMEVGSKLACEDAYTKDLHIICKECTSSIRIVMNHMGNRKEFEKIKKNFKVIPLDVSFKRRVDVNRLCQFFQYWLDD